MSRDPTRAGPKLKGARAKVALARVSCRIALPSGGRPPPSLSLLFNIQFEVIILQYSTMLLYQCGSSCIVILSANGLTAHVPYTCASPRGVRYAGAHDVRSVPYSEI